MSLKFLPGILLSWSFLLSGSAAQFSITSFDRQGNLTWSNAFPAGVCTVESALQAITEMAADELEAWELSAMRDPRNWVRPAAALVLGGTAGTALVLLRARRRSRVTRQRNAAAAGAASLERSAERALRDFAQQARKLIDRS